MIVIHYEWIFNDVKVPRFMLFVILLVGWIVGKMM